MEWMNTSWEWVLANASFFSGVGTVAMAVIWAVYLQLIVHNFLSGKKPELIINRCNGDDFNAHCVCTNMSTGTAFIETILVRLNSEDNAYYADVTDIQYREGIDEDVIEQEKLRFMTRQGPINPGECLDVGRFGMLIEHVASLNDITLDESSQPVDGKPFTHLEVFSISIYGRQRHPVGASRAFTITPDQHGKYRLAPEKSLTRQLISRRKRKEIEHWQSTLNRSQNAARPKTVHGSALAA